MLLDAIKYKFKVRLFSSDFLSIICKNFNLQKPMATPQEFILSCEKNKGCLKSSFHFFSSCFNESVSCKKQSRYGVYYSLDIQTSLSFSQRSKFL